MGQGIMETLPNLERIAGPALGLAGCVPKSPVLGEMCASIGWVRFGQRRVLLELAAPMPMRTKDPFV